MSSTAGDPVVGVAAQAFGLGLCANCEVAVQGRLHLGVFQSEEGPVAEMGVINAAGKFHSFATVSVNGALAELAKVVTPPPATGTVPVTALLNAAPKGTPLVANASDGEPGVGGDPNVASNVASPVPASRSQAKRVKAQRAKKSK